MRSIAKKLVFAVSASSVYTIVAVFANFIIIRLLFVYLNGEVVAFWFLMIGAQAMLGMFDLGFGQTAQRRIAFVKGKFGDDPDLVLPVEGRNEVREIIATTRGAYSVISTIVFVLIFVCGKYYFSEMSKTLDPELNFDLAWIIVCIGFAANTWGWFVSSLLNGIGDVGWSNIANISVQILYIFAVWFILALGFQLVGLSMVWLVKGVLTRLLGWLIFIRRNSWASHHGGGFSLSLLKQLLSPSIRSWLAIVGNFLLAGSSRYFLAELYSPKIVPDYVATYTAYAAIQGMFVGVTVSGTPLFSQLIKANNKKKLAEYVLLLSRVSLSCLVSVFCVFIVFGPTIFQLWLGEGHYLGLFFCIVLALLMTVEAHSGLLLPVCIAAERLSFYKSVLIGGVVNILIAIILIPRFGVLGAVIGIFVAQTVTQSWIIPNLAMKVLQIRFGYVIRRVLFPSFLSFLFSLLICLAGYYFLGQSVYSICLSGILVMGTLFIRHRNEFKKVLGLSEKVV